MKLQISIQERSGQLRQSSQLWRAAVVAVFALSSGSIAFGSDYFLDEGDGEFNVTPPALVNSPNYSSDSNSGRLGANSQPTQADQSQAVPDDLLKMADAYSASSPGASDEMGADPSSKGLLSSQEMDPSSEMAIAPTNGEMATMQALDGGNVAASTKTKSSSQKQLAKQSKSLQSKVASAKNAKKKANLAQAKKSSKKRSIASMNAGKGSSSKRKQAQANTGRLSRKGKVAVGKSSPKKSRSVASFAGGSYQTSTKECSMTSAPGGAEVTGVVKSNRKIWVEASGKSMYRVFNKEGQPAFVSKNCFQ